MWDPHVYGLRSGTVIYTSCKLINKFMDLDVHFESLGTGMTLPVKFEGRRYILLLFFK